MTTWKSLQVWREIERWYQPSWRSVPRPSSLYIILYDIYSLSLRQVFTVQLETGLRFGVDLLPRPSDYCILVELPTLMAFQPHPCLSVAAEACFLPPRQNLHPATKEFERPGINIILLPVLNPPWRTTPRWSACLAWERSWVPSSASQSKANKTLWISHPMTPRVVGSGESLVSFPSTWTQKTQKAKFPLPFCYSQNIQVFVLVFGLFQTYTF